jgi:AAA ATPase domain
MHCANCGREGPAGSACCCHCGATQRWRRPGRPLNGTDLRSAARRTHAGGALAVAVEPAARPAAEGTAFVGRARGLAELRAGLDDAIEGRGRLVLLAGEPGIGKTCTVERLAAEARARDSRVLVGRCHALAGPLRTETRLGSGHCGGSGRQATISGSSPGGAHRTASAARRICPTPASTRTV